MALRDLNGLDRGDGQMNQADPQGLTQFEDAIVPVELPEHDATEASVGDQFEAIKAGRSCHVDVRALETHARACCLDNSVGLRVNGSHAMAAFIHEMPYVVAMREPPYRPVVAGGQNHSVADNNGAHVLAIARGAGGNLQRNCHEILVPADSLGLSRLLHGVLLSRSAGARVAGLQVGVASGGSSLTFPQARGFVPPVRKTLPWLRSARLAIPLVLLPAALAMAQAPEGKTGGVRERAERLIAVLSSASAAVPAGLPPGSASSANTGQAPVAASSSAAAPGPASSASLVGEPLRFARVALERAKSTSAAGDAPHSGLLEALALEWAETGRDLQRTGEREHTAGRLEREAAAVEAKLLRAQALLEQTVARRGRAQVEVDQASQARAVTGAQAASLHPPSPKSKPPQVPPAPNAGPATPKASASPLRRSP